MTSEPRTAGNRRNAAKSTGPRTSGGKARVSRNALRHGLATAAFDTGNHSEKIEHIARLIAGKARDGARYEQAVIIAECGLLLSRIRLFRVQAIERFRERRESPFFPGSPLPQEIDGLARQNALGNRRAERDIIWRLAKATEAGFKELKAGLKDARRGDVSRLAALNRHFKTRAATPRTDVECLMLAFSEICALERYERRTLSRRRRAIRIFDALGASR